MNQPARVLSIAGSDSSGGAGIQADIKTATALGAYAMTAITAITAQDTTGVGAIVLIAPAVVREQMERCLSDIGADVIKTGMLGSAETVRAVAPILRTQARGIPLVVDPVMIATSGARLAESGVVEAMKAELFPLATLITPNLPEAERLCGFELRTPQDLHRAGEALLSLGPHAVLLKGGHGASDTLVDLLFAQDAVPCAYSAQRIETRHTHGTGCTLSTAIACGLGQGMPLPDAIERAHAYVQRAIRTAPGFGAGNGPINHLQT
ncbi:MAG: bifunctional hydroxymethylpyrimidine kinase/phosphomethylpyrimidine kinase [Alphaproteobacteria bacterium]|nr:bifunctional hydroxymethylpyrimidine kinase/phosphomethylpyrimidine kinase [Alphaproteobacteria bacterium]MBL6938333.1 bifunctional hydroxymethylpyrimidine kinase/phosphomethylpyrimidine kinase [Alphaproteobacteria bacterium]MBL7097389.1 bifunctional hydroxymethylpyrimidine kinase/phosphomethylpyrimidine kinase [Alphaproteobacteria bacterium]